MTQEELDFIYAEQYQLENVDFSTGKVDLYRKTKTGKKVVYYDVHYINVDGYHRIRLNGRLRMKHRFIYWLYYKQLPDEIDHINKIRNDNSISNLQNVNRSQNTKGKSKRKPYKHLTVNEVHEICQLLKDDAPITHIANKFNRSRTQIKAILAKKYWTHISNLYF